MTLDCCKGLADGTKPVTVDRQEPDSGYGTSAGLPLKKPRDLKVMISALILGLVAALVVNTLPVFLSVLARSRGLDEVQSGLIAFADMGGIACGTVLCALSPGKIAKYGYRAVALLGVGTLAVANVAAALSGAFHLLLAACAAAGVGSGIAMAVTYAVLAEGDGARDLALFNVVQLASGWLGIPLLDPIAKQHGAGSLFAVLAAVTLAAAPLCMALPRAPRNTSEQVAVASERVTRAGWLSILSVFLYFSGAGAIYSYLAFMGVAWGGSPESVEANLSTIMFAAMTGGIFVTIIGSRFGLRWPLCMGFGVLLLSIAMLATIQPVKLFLLVGCVFGFAWNVVTPFQFEAVTVVDPSNSAAMLVNAGTLGGFAVGPGIAGFMATPDYLRVNLLALIACVLSLALLLFLLRKRHGANDI
jgi:MFS family permease